MHRKKEKTDFIFCALVVVSAVGPTFSALAMRAVRMQGDACPPSYAACVEPATQSYAVCSKHDKKQSSQRVRAHILDLEARQQSEAERCCCWCPWQINQAVLDDIQAVAQEEELVGLSPANEKNLKSYSEKLQRRQAYYFDDATKKVKALGWSAIGTACVGASGAAQSGIMVLEYGVPALCLCGCCTLAVAAVLDDHYSASDFKRNNALDSLLASLSRASASEQSTRAVHMDNKKRKSRASASEDDLDDILSEDEHQDCGSRRAREVDERDQTR